MKSTQLFGRILGIAVATAGAFTATSASAQTRVDLDGGLLDTFKTQFVQDEKAFLGNAAQLQVDLNDLVFTGHSGGNTLDVFFINEGAKNRNSLSVGVAGSSYQNSVFGDISSTKSVLSEKDGVLDLGQGVSFLPGTPDLKPELQLGASLEFILTADGASLKEGEEPQYVYSTTKEKNVDGLQHVVGYNYFDGMDNWLILGFEDLYGELGATGVDAATGLENERSDRDFNDVVIALRGVSAKESVPEPGMVMGLAGAAALGALRRRKSAK